MPVYNCEKYIHEAVESILNQTYADFEFIIVNDGSTDNTLNILNEYANKDSRIRVINQPNSGIVVALNRGLNEAKGEWIFRMDGDDISLPHRFAVQVEEIKANPSLVLLGGWCQQINAEGVPLKINKYPTTHKGLVCKLETLRPFFPHPTACFRCEIVKQIGGYRERFRHAEDMDLWLRMIGIGKFACSEHVVLKLRKHEGNISNLNSGRIQQIRSMAARICYFRRKFGYSDPSQMIEEEWVHFLNWVESRMEQEGYFQKILGYQKLRNIWLSEINSNKLMRIVLLAEGIFNNPEILVYIWSRINKENIALKVFRKGLEII